jgi:hydrogenase/urease accessory protein HupE
LIAAIRLAGVVRQRLAWALLLLGAVPLVASAHDARPAYLQIDQVAAERYEVTWRTPVFSGMQLPVTLSLPVEARDVRAPHVRQLSDSLVERRTIDVPGGLAGKRVEFPGLQATITDVLVRVQALDGGSSTTLVRARQPWVEIEARQGALDVMAAYVVHGIGHILGGYDHLLFVFALVLLVRSLRVLLFTVTAFTLAHSITLALATLGVVHVPGPPVEATIALSILLLATEIVRVKEGYPSMTARWPWVVAFAFGLLHGFGFAGALTEIGLPRGDVPLALFAFNVGVEAGQLMFIGALLALFELSRRIALLDRARRAALPFAAYPVGALAAFWFIDRLQAFVPG